LDEIATAEFGRWGEDYEPLSARMGECFLLPHYGSDSRHVYAVTEEDTLGEYPVIVIDVDDLPMPESCTLALMSTCPMRQG
jgi:hypothetical protein